MMNDDAADKQEPTEASAALQRQVDMVYAYALRQTKDEHVASDVMQAVFVILARKRKAGRAPPEKFLLGWLFKVTSYAVKEVRRAAARRAYHEKRVADKTAEAFMLSEAEKEELMAVVDASMLRLSAMDREVVVRRYLQGQSLAEVAAAVGMTENTTGRRVTRALEKLRKMLARQNVHASPAMIAALVGEQAMVHAPQAATAAVMSATVAPQAAALAKAVLSGVLVMKIAQIGLVTAAVIAVSAGAWAEYRSWGAAGAATQGQGATNSAAMAPELTVTAVLEENSDTLLQEVLAVIERERVKIRTLEVESTVRKWQWDAAQKRLAESLAVEGHAWVEVATPRRTRLEVSRYRTGDALNGGMAPNEQSFVEVWDGTMTRVLQGPPLSVPQGSVKPEWQSSQGLLAGSAYSLHLLHDASVHRKLVPGPHPMARESFYSYEVKARRVMLQGDREAVELTMDAPRHDRPYRQFFLDPKRGDALLGLTQTFTKPDVPRTEVVVVDAFVEAAPGIFFPKSARRWTWDQEAGVVTSREEYEVKRVAANGPIPAGTFELAFPPGVPVQDLGDAASQPAASAPAVPVGP
jgi:RNA polymerase sigma factor (sigma-70 family)